MRAYYYFMKLNYLKHTCKAVILLLIHTVSSQKFRHSYLQNKIEDGQQAEEFLCNQKTLCWVIFARTKFVSAIDYQIILSHIFARSYLRSNVDPPKFFKFLLNGNITNMM